MLKCVVTKMRATLEPKSVNDYNNAENTICIIFI